MLGPSRACDAMPSISEHVVRKARDRRTFPRLRLSATLAELVFIVAFTVRGRGLADIN